jgi:hypothetical protein
VIAAPCVAENDGRMDDEPEGLAVLRAIWTARDHGVDVRAEIGSGTGKVCRRLQNVGGPVDDDQRTAWRELLEREGKRGATTLAELVADRDGAAPETGSRP